jgi:hypothetical protein
MSLCDPALQVRAEPDPWSFTCDDRQWRVRGLETRRSDLRLRVNLLVTRQGLSHVDTLDLYSARQRRMFVQEAAAELYVDEAVLKGDLGRVLWQLEEHQQAQRLLQPLRVVIPFARQLTFRTDQTRYRRDHAHYLSLIAASALGHQYQRQRVTQQGEPCLLATLDDLELANRLAGAALAAASHSLLPQTRQLLRQISTYVGQRAQQQRIPPEQVRFTQRQLREALAWSDHSLRRQLRRLVELEYVLTYRTGQGNQRAYQLLHGGQDGEGMPLVWGLTDVAQLRHGATPGASFPAHSPAE